MSAMWMKRPAQLVYSMCCKNQTTMVAMCQFVDIGGRCFSTQNKDSTNGTNDTIGKDSNNTIENEKPNIASIEKSNENKHIQIHAYRSLITLSTEPIDVSELNLTFSEKKALQFARKNENLTDNESINSENDIIEHNRNKGNLPAPAIAYEVWHSPPEVYDRIYGFESECEPPDRHNIQWKWLYKAWGYYAEREIRYRCGLYCYMKAQRRCAREEFWDVFDLENTFRVELQLLCLHLWFAKTRMVKFAAPKGHKLCYKTFKVMFEQLGNRFGKHMCGTKSRWQSDCQQACLHFCVSLDHALEDYSMDKDSFAKVIWNELYLSNKDMEHDLLYLWTDYIMQEINCLGDTNEKDFLNGWWKYGSIPTMQDRVNIRQKIVNEYELDEEERSIIMQKVTSKNRIGNRSNSNNNHNV